MDKILRYMSVEKNTFIGDALVEKGIIRENDLTEALREQQSCGSQIGKIFMGNGKISAYQFYKELAENIGMEFADLVKNPPDTIFLEDDERKNYIKLSAIPWKREGKSVLIATSEVTSELHDWAKNKYGTLYSLVMTSPLDICWTIQTHFATNDDEDAREELWKKYPDKSAKELFLDKKSSNIIILTLITFSSLMFFNSVMLAFFIAINVFYASTLLFKITFFSMGFLSERSRTKFLKKHKIPTCITDNNNLPVYTLLIPMYNEKMETVSRLVESIRAFDYPKSLLDVKLIVEKDDEKTILAIKNLKCENIFEIIRVPYSLPRTKPKACNYALKFARGEYVTIYDADDIPDPKQLKTVLWRFRNSKEDIVCVQSRLNYYNRKENILTRLFAIEYSSWFDFMLPGLEVLKMPIPLGGTSNHFPVEFLRSLDAWDPYNVTEDADLGIRIASKGHRTAIIDSVTMEEAPITLRAWIKQRSRWIKGYMQTWIVHMRNPKKLYDTLGLKGFLGFSFFVGAPSVVFITIPVVLVISLLSWFCGNTFPDWFIMMSGINMAASIIVHISISIVVICKNKWFDMIIYSLLFPFYWALHSISSIKALWQLITKPHFWDKTEHGLTKVSVSSE